MIIQNLEKPPTWVRMEALNSSDDDPVRSADLALENAVKPKTEEPALIHPFNTSIVKIRNNGMIDMFVGTDQGIRLDPYSKTLNEIVDGLKWHIGYFTGWIDRDAKWYAENNFLFDSKNGSIELSAKKDITLKCEGKLTIECESFSIKGSDVGMEVKDGSICLDGKGHSLEEDGENKITSGSSTLLVDGKGVARIGDDVNAVLQVEEE